MRIRQSHFGQFYKCPYGFYLACIKGTEGKATAAMLNGTEQHEVMADQLRLGIVPESTEGLFKALNLTAGGMVEHALEAKFGEHAITGTPDYIEMFMAEQRAVILDWKFSNSAWNGYEYYQSEAAKVQPTIYAYLLAARFLGIKTFEFHYVFPDDEKEITISLTAAEVQDGTERITAPVFEAIEAENYPSNAETGKSCQGCLYLSDCDKAKKDLMSLEEVRNGLVTAESIPTLYLTIQRCEKLLEAKKDEIKSYMIANGLRSLDLNDSEYLVCQNSNGRETLDNAAGLIGEMLKAGVPAEDILMYAKLGKEDAVKLAGDKVDISDYIKIGKPYSILKIAKRKVQ